MRVLITGGAGFLGSHLSDAFIARGDEVFVLDTGSIAKVRHILNNPRFHYVHDSVFNVELIDSLVSRVDLIYHLAAVVGVEHYVADPYETLNVNVNGTQNVLKAAYKHNKRVVFSSTSEVYGRIPRCRGARTTIACSVRPVSTVGVTRPRRRWVSTSVSHITSSACRLPWCVTSTPTARGSTRSTWAGCSRSSWGNFCAART